VCHIEGVGLIGAHRTAQPNSPYWCPCIRPCCWTHTHTYTHTHTHTNTHTHIHTHTHTYLTGVLVYGPVVGLVEPVDALYGDPTCVIVLYIGVIVGII
jgi:carbohydrate-binding DOMON domain-containing protein